MAHPLLTCASLNQLTCGVGVAEVEGKLLDLVGSERGRAVQYVVVSTWSKPVESATLEAARLRPRGGGWAPSGWASLWECRAA